MKAQWNGFIIAESENTIVVEGNHYFPPESIKLALVKPSSTETTCGWKGVASYYTLEVDGKKNPDAAWFYANPKDKAQHIKNYVAFWKDVKVD